MSSRYLNAIFLGALVGVSISFTCGQCGYWLWAGWSIPAAQTQQMAELIELQMLSLMSGLELGLGAMSASLFSCVMPGLVLVIAWIETSRHQDRRVTRSR